MSNYYLEEPEMSGKSKLWVSVRAKIEKTVYNGKECYVIDSDRFAKDPNEHTIYYIEKDTGLIVRQVDGTRNTDYEYEFGNVEDKVFEEPNIAEYEIIKNK